MSRADFYELLEMVRPRLTRSVEMGRRGGHETVLPAARLGITLWMLAGGKCADKMVLYAICRQTVFDIFEDTVSALSKKQQLPLFSNTDKGLQRLAEGMKLSRKKDNPLTGCIGALDGIYMKIKNPQSEMSPAIFYCRKGYYAIPVQALVDSDYRFLCVSANCAGNSLSGSTHDSLAYSSSKLGIYLNQGLLDKQYWIAGDEGYACTESLLTPYPASQLHSSTFRAAFNFFLSSMRIHVEQAFGIFKAKWGILEYLEFELEKCSQVIIVAMKLHNYCLGPGSGQKRRYVRSQSEMNRIRSETEEWYRVAKKRRARPHRCARS